MKHLILFTAVLITAAFTAQANTLLSITTTGGTGTSGNYSFNGSAAHPYYVVSFTVASDFSNGAATAQLEGQYNFEADFSTYLYDNGTEVASGAVGVAHAPYPIESYNLFSGPLSFYSGHTYEVFIAGSGGTIWDTAGTPSVSHDANLTYTGSSSAETLGGSLTGISNDLIFSLTADPGAATPEPASFALFSLAGVTLLALRRRRS